MSQQTAVLLLGSNLGNRKKNLESAMHKISSERCTILSISNYLTSDPVEFVSSNYFCNIALTICTPFSPIGLLNFVKKIESEMGRNSDTKATGNYTDRLIDIDIVKYGNLNFSSERLMLPHKKHLFEREFSRILLENFI